jgi:hypothetical protein
VLELDRHVGGTKVSGLDGDAVAGLDPGVTDRGVRATRIDAVGVAGRGRVLIRILRTVSPSLGLTTARQSRFATRATSIRVRGTASTMLAAISERPAAVRR